MRSSSSYHGITKVHLVQNTIIPTDGREPFTVTSILINDEDGDTHDISLFGNLVITLGEEK